MAFSPYGFTVVHIKQINSCMVNKNVRQILVSDSFLNSWTNFLKCFLSLMERFYLHLQGFHTKMVIFKIILTIQNYIFIKKVHVLYNVFYPWLEISANIFSYSTCKHNVETLETDLDPNVSWSLLGLIIGQVILRSGLYLKNINNKMGQTS